MPLLFPEKTFVKLVPSVETASMKLYWRVAPSAQAISTPHTDFNAPKLALIHGLTLNVEYHLVLRLLSIALVGGNEL